MRTVDEFTPVPDQPNYWVDAEGLLYIGREGQTIESFVEELNAAPTEPFWPPEEE